jgi:hypothetical protein
MLGKVFLPQPVVELQTLICPNPLQWFPSLLL